MLIGLLSPQFCDAFNTKNTPEEKDRLVKAAIAQAKANPRPLMYNQSENPEQPRFFFNWLWFFLGRVFWCLILGQCNPPQPSKACGIQGVSSRSSGDAATDGAPFQGNGTDRIVGGGAADVGEYPWMVHLRLGKTAKRNLSVRS